MNKDNPNKFWINYHKKRIARLRKRKYMRPPWVLFPGCSCWTQGYQEAYMWDFQDWFKALSPERKLRYVKKNPVPEEMQKYYKDCSGFYFMIGLTEIDPQKYWENRLKRYLARYK